MDVSKQTLSSSDGTVHLLPCAKDSRRTRAAPWRRGWRHARCHATSGEEGSMDHWRSVDLESALGLCKVVKLETGQGCKKEFDERGHPQHLRVCRSPA
jgi:hypothetical protein